MNTQRRIFRGRGGPTDGRLPKHNARRRKQQHGARKPTTNKYADDQEEQQEKHEEIMVIMQEEEVSPSSDDDSDNNDEEELEIEEEAIETDTRQAPLPTTTTTTTTITSAEEASATPPPWHSEIQHLKRRLKNVQESIQTSQGISNPPSYEANVLNAVENCIKEWKSILKFYPDMDPETVRQTSLAVYGLVQFSLQCGPLAGAKPGYFKRCGGTVAKMVLNFLNRVAPTLEQDQDNSAVVKELGFSHKQATAIRTWKNNATKAAQADKPQSKSALKKQQEGKSKKKKLTKKSK